MSYLSIRVSAGTHKKQLPVKQDPSIFFLNSLSINASYLDIVSIFCNIIQVIAGGISTHVASANHPRPTIIVPMQSLMVG